MVTPNNELGYNSKVEGGVVVSRLDSVNGKSKRRHACHRRDGEVRTPPSASGFIASLITFGSVVVTSAVCQHWTCGVRGASDIFGGARQFSDTVESLRTCY